MECNGFRFYYDKPLSYLITEELKYNKEYLAIRYAKSRLRMYANLFNRDIRKKILNADSVCVLCESSEKLNIDHIIPITLGGKNDTSNIQILCSKCNIKKSNKL